MKISVIIPVHNLENQIVQCLESVVSQDFDKQEYEILLVLDACTDNTESVVRNWHDLHRNVNK